MMKSSITYISKTEFLPAFYAAFQATMTESNIKGGSRGAGLVPLNPENVISKLDVKLRTPTPNEELFYITLSSAVNSSASLYKSTSSCSLT
jgi:hypothetical protein